MYKGDRLCGRFRRHLFSFWHLQEIILLAIHFLGPLLEFVHHELSIYCSYPLPVQLNNFINFFLCTCPLFASFTCNWRRNEFLVLARHCPFLYSVLLHDIFEPSYPGWSVSPEHCLEMFNPRMMCGLELQLFPFYTSCSIVRLLSDLQLLIKGQFRSGSLPLFNQCLTYFFSSSLRNVSACFYPSSSAIHASS